NRAYEEAYGVTGGQVIGETCHKISHGNDRPCYEYGEICPHQHVLEKQDRFRCVHVHRGDDGQLNQVLVRAYILKGADGEYYVAEDIESLESENDPAHEKPQMVGNSPAFLRVLDLLQLASSSEAPVLLEGETGTGKELAARFVHDHSARRDKPFLTLDCTVLTESLFEAEVFGYERGAFTGSVGEKEGLFEVAHGGTLFLDEIGEMSPALQAKLLRVLETGEFRRVGGRKTLHTDARIICATNRHLGHAIAEQHFRQDLYYRVACLSIHMPSLRERLEDIPLLTEALLQRIGGNNGRRYIVTGDALGELADYSYPGNIRELRNILDAVVAHSSGNTIEGPQVAAAIDRYRRHQTVATAPAGNDRRRDDVAAESGQAGNLKSLEEEHIRQLLERYSGNRRKVAKALGVSERTVYRKLKQYRYREDTA
ncbi:MAG: sigma-54 dependent transcriptional regulator, partial [Gammaproteobacteria bacterium]